MNPKILQEAGLTHSQAAAYTALVKKSPCSPPRLAEHIQESRTNAYKLLEQLEELGLVSRDETRKKLRYWANNPSMLVDVVKKRRFAAEEAEKRFNDSLPSLMNEYFENSERPSVQYFHGAEGVKRIYDDQLKTHSPITMIRTSADIKFFGSFEAMSKIRTVFNQSDITRHMFTPDTPEARVDWKEHDKNSGNTRTWLENSDYTAPVEWAVYGNKLGIISFGEEAIGMIIESSQIAKAFKQILTVLDTGTKLRPGYKLLPRLASKKLPSYPL